MEKHRLLEKYKESKNFNLLIDAISNPNNKRIALNGLIGSSCGFYISNLFTKSDKSLFIILNDKEEAAYFYNDLKDLCDEESILFFPSSYKRSVQYDNIENNNIVQRTEIISTALFSSKKSIIVSYPEAIIEKIVSTEGLRENTLTVQTGESLSVDFLIEVLNEYKFERTDFVYEPGQFSVRGSIIDIFSYTYDKPFRIDFFGDEVETIRSFNVENQLSERLFDNISIVINLKENISNEQKVNLFTTLTQDYILWINDFEFVSNQIDLIHQNTIKTNPDKERVASHACQEKAAEGGRAIHGRPLSRENQCARRYAKARF